jgi:hypothetical protein
MERPRAFVKKVRALHPWQRRQSVLGSSRLQSATATMDVANQSRQVLVFRIEERATQKFAIAV